MVNDSVINKQHSESNVLARVQFRLLEVSDTIAAVFGALAMKRNG